MLMGKSSWGSVISSGIARDHRNSATFRVLASNPKKSACTLSSLAETTSKCTSHLYILPSTKSAMPPAGICNSSARAGSCLTLWSSARSLAACLANSLKAIVQYMAGVSHSSKLGNAMALSKRRKCWINTSDSNIAFVNSRKSCWVSAFAISGFACSCRNIRSALVIRKDLEVTSCSCSLGTTPFLAATKSLYSCIRSKSSSSSSSSSAASISRAAMLSAISSTSLYRGSHWSGPKE
mmetsp:Transcript_41023/g.89424  ORF Transcript_41023/g.89424 Transcript_41023/m.89424 type:complete len:237 (+) Transcript_41023:141-851(+)